MNYGPFNLAVADYFRAPGIEEIITTAYTGAMSGKIEVIATDDTKVTEVRVSILAPSGSAIESGVAVLDPNGKFIYMATSNNASPVDSRIVVVAKDLRGNTRVGEKVMELLD